MTNFTAIKNMPLKSFANMVFEVVSRECKSEEEFVAFLEKEIPSELEEKVKKALQSLQCSSST